jgi:hypothetical protein
MMIGAQPGQGRVPVFAVVYERSAGVVSGWI